MWPFGRKTGFEVRSSRPYWLMRDGTGDASPTLTQSLDCDVAIVGAGITGVLIADALVGSRARVVLLDQNAPGQGSTSASTALIQYENDVHLIDMMRLLGAERATLAYRASMESFALLESRFSELLAPSNYQRSDSVYLAADEGGVEALRAERSARQAIGIAVDWLDADELRRSFGCHRPAALLSRLAATLDPLRFTRAILAGCMRHGVEVFSRVRVQSLDSRGERVALVMDEGLEVRASHVVIAAGYESARFSPPVADIDNTFALVTEPLADSAAVARMPQFWESSRPYLYLRGTPDGRLMLGGADLPFKNPALREVMLPRQVRKLARAYEDLFARPLPPIAAAWAGSFAKTADGLPFIGRAPGSNPRVQYALCYGGNGITFALHAGDMIRAGIENRPHALEAVFGFARLGKEASKAHG